MKYGLVGIDSAVGDVLLDLCRIVDLICAGMAVLWS